MEKKNVNKNLVAALLVVIAVLGYGLIGRAGNLDPNDPPAPTMKTLQEIYDAVEATQTTVVTEGSGVSQREGYIKYLGLGSGLTDTLFTVPAGKRFVLLKIFVDTQNWQLTVNDNTFVHAVIMYYHGSTQIINMIDFPDRCVVVDAGDTLKFVNQSGGTINYHIVGYFYDVS